MEKKILSVYELTKNIKQNLEDGFSAVWVEGEVSNFVRHSSGHMYFTIKDKEAQLHVVMFRYVNRSLTFTIENGLHIVIFGKISVYEKRGSYQLIAEIIEPKGIGALQLAFEQLKEKLKKEGLFAAEHKKALPVFPRVIGVVTSPTGAAIRDILQIINRRFSNVNVLLYPVKVQGEGAASEIRDAIDALNEYARCDVIIIGRGGGSLEDLWAFNEEAVARAVYRSEIPIISAVGHEIDFTISDFVADLRAPTPSAAAELVVVRKDEVMRNIDGYKERLGKAVASVIEDYRTRIDAITNRYVFREPMALVNSFAQRFDELVRQLNDYMKMCVQEKQRRFQNCVGKLHVLSPLNILSRGYSISTEKETKKVVRDSAAVSIGDVILTKLHKGSIESTVTKKN